MRKFLIAILIVFSLGIFINIYSVKAVNIYDYSQLEDSKCGGLKSQLQQLKNQYPNYEFKIYDTGQTWENAINMEYQGHGNSPKNLTYKTSSYNGMWICPICNTTLYDNSLYCASIEALQYMMDPRNSISMDSIFQFEDLTSNSATVEDIRKMVTGTFLNDDEVIQAIFDGCNSNNISAYYIVTLLIQEQGTKGTTLSRGYNGYYNFFNIGAYGNGASAIINNGYNYAVKNGWNNKRKAIIDGIQIIGSRYVGKGQNTIYFQKFNVTPADMYNHQYQQGIMAAESESRIMKKYYTNAGTMANKRTFLIPIFENMSSTASARPDTNKQNTISYEKAKVNVSSSLRVYSSQDANHLELASIPANAIVKILSRAKSKGFNGLYLDLVVCEANGVYGYVARGTSEKDYLVPITSTNEDNDSSNKPTTLTDDEKINNNKDIIKNMFDADLYSAKYPDLKTAFGTDNDKLFEHYLQFGIKEGRTASYLYDHSFYINRYSDLKAAFKDDYKKALLHFIEFGLAEKRIASQYFNIGYYLHKNADVLKLYGETNYKEILKHFNTAGIKEGRIASTDFDVKFYISFYEDLEKAYGKTGYKSAYQHYVLYGKKENRYAIGWTPKIDKGKLDNILFNSQFYSITYQDVKNAYQNVPNGYYVHWNEFGKKEGRMGSVIFDPDYYLNKYPDVKQVYNNSKYAAYEHFINFGLAEGRQGSIFFNINYYIQNNRDVTKAYGCENYVEIVNHFITFGIPEGRQGSSAFSQKIYKASNQDLSNTFKNDNIYYFTHYIIWGRNEGRKII